MNQINLKRLVELRNEREWSLATLSAKVGISVKYLHDLESGKATNPSLGTMFALAKVYSYDDLGVFLRRLSDAE